MTFVWGNFPSSFSKNKPCKFCIKIPNNYSRKEKRVQICCLRKVQTSKCIAAFVHKAELFLLHCFSILCKKYFKLIYIDINSVSSNLISFAAFFIFFIWGCTCKFFFLMGGTKYFFFLSPTIFIFLTRTPFYFRTEGVCKFFSVDSRQRFRCFFW